jgi:hypothetical protein
MRKFVNQFAWEKFEHDYKFSHTHWYCLNSPRWVANVRLQVFLHLEDCSRQSSLSLLWWWCESWYAGSKLKFKSSYLGRVVKEHLASAQYVLQYTSESRTCPRGRMVVSDTFCVRLSNG